MHSRDDYMQICTENTCRNVGQEGKRVLQGIVGAQAGAFCKQMKRICGNPIGIDQRFMKDGIKHCPRMVLRSLVYL